MAAAGRYLVQHPLRVLLQLGSTRSASVCSLNRLSKLSSFGNGFSRHQPVTWCAIRTYASKKGKQSKEKKSKVEAHRGSKHHRLELNPEDYEDIVDLEKMKSQMQSALDHLKANYIQNLSLRTSAGSFEQLMVDTKDGQFPINQLGQVSMKSPQLLLINMTTTPQHIAEVIDAIRKSGMNVNPQQDGNTISIPIPRVTTEFRENLVKSAKTQSQLTKEKVNLAYTKSIKSVKSNKGGQPEDLIWNIEQMLLDVMHEYKAEAEKMFSIKQHELLEEDFK